MPKKKKPLIAKVTSLGDLRWQAQTSPAHKRLAMLAASNLGGPSDTFEQAMRCLDNNAMETSEEDVVNEVNGMRDMITPDP